MKATLGGRRWCGKMRRSAKKTGILIEEVGMGKKETYCSYCTSPIADGLRSLVSLSLYFPFSSRSNTVKKAREEFHTTHLFDPSLLEQMNDDYQRVQYKRKTAICDQLMSAVVGFSSKKLERDTENCRLFLLSSLGM